MLTKPPGDGGPDDPLYIFLLGLYHGQRVDVGDGADGNRYVVMDAHGDPNKVIAVDPAVLDAAEARGWLAIGDADGDVKLTEAGRYHLGRWVNRNRRRLGLRRHEGAEALCAEGK